MHIDIWSDVVCPWCWIGKRRFERALAEFPHRADVRIQHRSFQLDPTRGYGEVASRRAALEAKYGLSGDEVDRRNEQMERIAAEEGLDYDLAHAVTGNTFGAHQLLHLAGDRGRQDATLERFFRAYFSEQRSLFDDESLVALAGEAGLDEIDARAALSGGTYAAAVREDMALARTLGITGVPFFVVDRRFGISGARLPEVFRDVLDRAWGETVGRP